jgi:misacylated tRNA(Ala) deacylase
MTELIYQTDSYLTNFKARVASVDPEARTVALDRTAFYPGGGGQPSDRGYLNYEGEKISVLKAKKSGESVLHFLGLEEKMPKEGVEVEGVIDWDHRYQVMRTHTALHVLCGVVFRDYGALVTGGDMEPGKGRMDFEFETMHKDLVQAIETAVNEEIAKEHPVRVDILPREEAFQIPDLIRTKINLLPEGINFVRVVEIEQLDLQADGGTHVANTSEVGIVRVVDYKSKGKINKRIYIELE